MGNPGVQESGSIGLRAVVAMFNRVKDVSALPGMRLSVLFVNGTTKVYDASALPSRFPEFKALEDGLFFASACVDAGGYGVSWSDDIDISCDELWENGEVSETPFDGLMSFADASELWGLSESTLRKAVSYGKIVPGSDARKYGKQWVVTRAAMEREYGKVAAV